MNTSVFLLISICILKLSWCFSLTDEESIAQDGAGTEFPFSKAKVKYHRSRYCVTAFGQTNCVRMNTEPGDAAQLAKLYRIMLQGYQDSALRMSKEKALRQKVKPTLLRQGGQAVNEETVQLIKPRTLNDDEHSQLGQHIKPRILTQELNQHIKLKASEQSFIKPKKLSQEVKSKVLKESKSAPKFREFPYPSKMKETVRLKKYDSPKPRWQIAGGKPNHIPPIPRMNGY